MLLKGKEYERSCQAGTGKQVDLGEIFPLTLQANTTTCEPRSPIQNLYILHNIGNYLNLELKV